MRPLFIFCILLSLAYACNRPAGSSRESLFRAGYSLVEGYALGTSYHIKYENIRNEDYTAAIDSLLNEFENSMSTFRPGSVISRLNTNDPAVVPDEVFIRCFEKGQEVSEITGGAFDMTVAPLVNAWGFGFSDRNMLDSAEVKEMLAYVGYKKIRLENGKIVKDDPRVMLDASAIAKGQCVDCVCEFFEKKGIANYLVEIGGEVRAKGKRPGGEDWVIGIDKPVDNSDELNRELQATVNLHNKALATSGNYRRFYYSGGVRYSHTINPATGYPVNHGLLSASVLAKDCMTADAYATAFMVLGYEKSLKIVNETKGLEAYFIIAGTDNNYEIKYSDGFSGMLITGQ